MVDQQSEKHPQAFDKPGDKKRWDDFMSAYREVIDKVGDEDEVGAFFYHDTTNAMTLLTKLRVFPPYDTLFEQFIKWQDPESGLDTQSLLELISQLPDNTTNGQQVTAMLALGLQRMPEQIRPSFEKEAREDLNILKPSAKSILSALILSTDFLRNPTKEGLYQLDNVHVQLQDVIDYFALAKSARITVQYDSSVADEGNIPLNAQTFTVLFNLLHNATKFAQEVTVFLSSRGFMVINPAQYVVPERVFDVGEKEKNERGGHGYGLAIAKLFAQLTSADLRVNSVASNVPNADPYLIQFQFSPIHQGNEPFYS